MAHDHYAFLGNDHIPKSDRFHPGLYAGVLFHLFGLAAVEIDALAFLHDHLVAASSEGQLQSIARCSLRLAVILADADPHTDGDHMLAACIQAFDLIQDLKFVTLQSCEILSFEDHKIAVSVQLSHDTAYIAEILPDGLVDHRSLDILLHIHAAA